MRKISKTRSANLAGQASESDLVDTGSGRIQGATITSWPGSPDIDLDALFAQPRPGATVSGAPVASGVASETSVDERVPNGTVALSDGTQITFVTADTAERMKLA